tara:strand:+ start:118 stop:1992 length:1875 start_codon:yes stop_codon:yes gene_type:complete
MCGISGYVLNEIPDNIEVIFNKISHRGPDDSGKYSEKIGNNYVGLYHRRLSIYDLSKSAAQPMKSCDGNNILIFNGAIYNYKDLWKRLFGNNSITPTGDTQVLVEAISKWGSSKTWIESNGMFAVAFLDKKTSVLKLSRDRAGQKPLFYTLNPKINGQRYTGIIFASELKALSSLIDVSVDENYLSEYLLSAKIDASVNTLYSEIKRLEPAFELSFDINSCSVNLNNYWDLIQNVNSIVNLNSKDSIYESTKEFVDNAVKLQITGDRKLGIMLSSGVDSTVLACLMRSHTNKEIYSFTYDFDNCEVGESQAAKKTSDLLSLTYIESDRLTPNYVRENFLQTIRQQDEPITSIRTIAQHYIHQKASQEDCRILIEGNGGDEIFGGYDHYQYARLLDAMINPKMETNKLINQFQDFNINELIVGIRSILTPGICSKDATEARRIDAIDDWLKEDFITKQYQNILRLQQNNYSFTVKAQITDFSSIFLPRSLRYVDRASMASGNEARAPLLDHNVIAYGLASSQKKYLDNKERDILRKMGSKDVLDLSGSQKKTIVDPQRDWLYGDLFEWSLELLNESKEVLSKFYKFDTLINNLLEERIIWNQYRKGNSGAFMQAINLAILLNNDL